MSATDFLNDATAKKILDVLLHSNQNYFITGRAGTGKSTILRYFLSQLTQLNYVILAPTGVAALNVGGETFHHFMRLKPGASPEEVIHEARIAKKTKLLKLYTNLDLIVIDEISMVRADLFDALDIFLQTVRHSHAPFGGVRLICFGDLYQLPPVLTTDETAEFSLSYDSPYFFSSHAFQNLHQSELFCNFACLSLKTIYRQQDSEFIEFLNCIRHNTLTPAQLDRLNSRVLSDCSLDDLDPQFVILTVTRARAERINLHRLAQLPARAFSARAKTSGKFNALTQPTGDTLILKVGARVMLLNNDSDGLWVNGSTGEITDINKDEAIIYVRLDSGGEVAVTRHTWETAHSAFNAQTNKIDRQVVGSFTQFPLKLAWAITVHKSQGQTFEKIIIDFERGAFAPGQAYVAFSRGTNLDQIFLSRPLQPEDILVDPKIVTFATEHKLEE